MSDSEFEYYVEMLGQACDLSEESISRKFYRYCNGRLKHSDTDQDWDRPDFDLLINIQRKLDALWIYLAKYLHDRPKDYTTTDFSLVMKLLAVVEVLLNGRIAAQTAVLIADPTEGVGSAPVVVGQPADSMEVWG